MSRFSSIDTGRVRNTNKSLSFKLNSTKLLKTEESGSSDENNIVRKRKNNSASSSYLLDY